MGRTAATLALATTMVTAGATAASSVLATERTPQHLAGNPAQPRDVMFVGNDWAGTATVVDARTRSDDDQGP